MKGKVSGIQPRLRFDFDSVMAFPAHICMNRTIAEAFGCQCFIINLFDFVANGTFYSH